MSEPIVSPIGTFGNYRVVGIFDEKMLFPKRTVRTPTGEVKEESVAIKRIKKIIRLTHVATGERVEFSAYIHAGKLRFRDSREKSGDGTDRQVVSELARMTRLPLESARGMLQLSPA